MKKSIPRHLTVLTRPKTLGAFLVASVELGRMADARWGAHNGAHNGAQ